MHYPTRKRFVNGDETEWSRLTDNAQYQVDHGEPPTRLLITTSPGDLIEIEECEVTSTSDNAERIRSRPHFKVVCTMDEFEWLLNAGKEALAVARAGDDGSSVPPSERITRDIPDDESK
jgi:hypothetical protein